MVKKISEVPEGIKILAFLLFTGALFSLVMGIVMFGSSDAIRNIDPTLSTEVSFSQMNSWDMIFVGVFLIAISFFQYILGRDLLVAKNWAKITIGVFSILGIASAIMNFSNAAYASGTIGFVLNGVVAWYIFIKKNTKKFF